MFEIYKENQFPEGALRIEEERKALLSKAFCKVFLERNGTEPTVEIVRDECRIVENVDEESFERLPICAIYHKDVPLVRLYYRGGQYELHTLAKDASPWDIIMIVCCDEMNRDLVKKEKDGK